MGLARNYLQDKKGRRFSVAGFVTLTASRDGRSYYLRINANGLTASQIARKLSNRLGTLQTGPEAVLRVKFQSHGTLTPAEVWALAMAVQADYSTRFTRVEVKNPYALGFMAPSLTVFL
jgi:hypothetical protein